MKKLYIMTVISALAIITVEGFCSPVLVSVELPDSESKNVWRQLGIPTYELIDNNCIAEMEEALVGSLEQKGYLIKIIDKQPEISKYMIMANTDRGPVLKGNIIWQCGKTAIIKSASNNIFARKEYKHLARPMNTKPLGDKFWKSITAKYIPVQSISYDPFIQSLVDQVNADSIAANIQRLQDFGAREMITDSGYAASAWLANKYADMGLNGQLDSFYFIYPYDPLVLFGWEQNALGIKAGKCSKTIITGGHLDSSSDILGCAPGADDDASGVAGAMEIGRIMKNYIWDATLVFAGWAGEECGEGVGSTHYAKSADSTGQNIVGVLNLDMIGYMSDTTLHGNVWYSHDNSTWLTELFVEAGVQYVPNITYSTYCWEIHCDHYFFSREGYPAITAIDAGYENPYVHTINDLLSTLAPQSYVAYTQTALATMALLNKHPAPVEDITVRDMGTGDKLLVNWVSNEESNIDYYRIYWGKQSGLYSDSMEVDTITYALSGLQADTTYYICVRAVNADSLLSPVAYETTGIPKLVPLPPAGFKATPIVNGIMLKWVQSKECDFYCYKIYKRINDQPVQDSFAVAVISDTTYIDNGLTGENKYYYWISTYDIDGNRSSFSDSAYGRPVTLDQGILLVDETYNWTTGSWPRNVQQDSLYNYAMSGYKVTSYDYGSSLQKPILADFAPYSAVIWVGDDNTYLWASSVVNDLKCYLAAGGKLWFAGWKPTADIRNNASYPAEFTSGSFLYDNMLISHAELSGTADSFKTAVGLKGYPDINVDTLKYPSTIWGKTLRYIEALTPTGTGDTIYSIDMKNDGSLWEGRACAVRDSGKTVFFGFPLYFMYKEQVKAAVQKVMTEFGEPYGVTTERPGDREQRPVLRLYQNAPNPFSKQTVIRYQLPNNGHVSLNVYNIAGQLVKTLVNGERAAGSYTVKWEGNCENGRKAMAGVYFCQLTALGIERSVRFIMLK